MRELFIYYRVRQADAAAARRAVVAMQSALRRSHPGLHARWLTRDDAGDAQTWMESYALPGAATGIDAALAAAIEAEAALWSHLVDDVRHVESFRAED